jgi:hypothetical protein
MIAFVEEERNTVLRTVKHTGPGYDMSLPSMKPFMWVEGHSKVKCGNVTLGVLAFGAYNVFGLIGSEKGGVAVVTEAPSKHVLGTLDIPWNPAGRAVALKLMVEFLKKNRRALAKSADVLVPEFKRLGYDSRIA